MRGRRNSIGILISFALLSITINFQQAWAETVVAEKVVSVDVLGTGKLKVPAEFKPVKPKSRIVQYEFEARVEKGAEKDDEAGIARVTMMQAGGDVKANVRRWKGQFAGGDKAANKSEEISVGKWTVHIIDLNGSFGERVGGGPFAGGKVVQREKYAMTGVILVPKNGNPQGPKFFVKMIGPADVVKANRERLIQMVKKMDQ